MQINLNMKSILKFIFFSSSTILIYYLSISGKISKLATTILFILLSIFLLIVSWPIKYPELFRIIATDNLDQFKLYLKSHNLSLKTIHKFSYIFGKTPLIYAMERQALKIFTYMVENGYNLKYIGPNSEPPLTFAAHSAKLEFLQILLKNKHKLDLYAENNKFGANALEIAIWRDREKVVEALLNAGMKFSVKKYSLTKIGMMSIPFSKVSSKVKKILIKRYVFDKTVKQINLVDTFKNNENKEEKDKLKSFEGCKICWDEYLQYA